jgi:beta-barrel assembly-enhancing protease
MKKVFTQLFIICGLFFGCWFTLSQINFINLFGVQQTSQLSEAKIGQLLYDLFKHKEKELTDPQAKEFLQSIIKRICDPNNINTDSVKLHIIEKREINAFALPNHHLVIYSELIDKCETPEELAGVISHELAHMELNHVTKKIAKEIGLTVLVSLLGGNATGEVIKETTKILSSTAYDRSLEREADQMAVQYLINANIDPEHLANFLYRLAEEGTKLPKQFYWISTHPESKERALEIINLKIPHQIKTEPLLDSASWKYLKNTVR